MEDVSQTAERSLLLDFYGELLTPRQRELCDLSFNQDLSLSEIAEITGVSRQAVHDALRRAETTLAELEQKTGCVARTLRSVAAARTIRTAAQTLAHSADPAVRASAAAILDALAGLED